MSPDSCPSTRFLPERFEWTPGVRMVVRYRIIPPPVDGPHLTDALGEVQEVSADAVVIETQRGPVQICFQSVVAARRVPAAPPRRPLGKVPRPATPGGEDSSGSAEP